MDTSILVIDDSAVARRLIIDTLRQTALFTRYHEAASGIEGLELLRRQPVDVVLCDLEMPGIDGFRFLEMVGTLEELREIPVILLTGEEAQDRKIQGLERGASDYITKPFDPGELVARVKVQLKIKSLQDSLRESNRQLERLSMTDHLTGLANRRHFMETLEREFIRSRRTTLPLSLVMLDIDHFKKINDTYGHQRGDEVLVSVAELLQQSLRPYDTAARYGGEEFALVLPETSLDEAFQAAERLRRQTAQKAFAGAPGDLHITASLGVAAVPGAKIGSVDHLILEADAALYRAKRNGRDRVEAMLG